MSHRRLRHTQQAESPRHKGNQVQDKGQKGGQVHVKGYKGNVFQDKENQVQDTKGNLAFSRSDPTVTNPGCRDITLLRYYGDAVSMVAVRYW